MGCRADFQGQDSQTVKMRLSGALRSGVQFGKLAWSNRIIQFGISPHEIRTFPNLMDKPVPAIKFWAKKFMIIAPPTFLALTGKNKLDTMYAQSLRKDPTEFENDE